MTLRQRRLSPTLLGLALAFAAGGMAGTSSSAIGSDITAAPITTHTYLKARPGERARLATYLRANWFVMDAIAVQRGLFRSYRLLANTEEGGDWDLLVEVVYNDACGYACVAEEFEGIRRAHVPVPIDGKQMPELGQVVRSEQLQPMP